LDLPPPPRPPPTNSFFGGEFSQLGDFFGGKWKNSANSK